MFVRAFAKGELFDSVEWTVALTEYREKLNKHEIEDEEYYNVFPYFVEEQEEETPKKRSGGKVSIREAVMNSNLNSADTADLYAKQVDGSQMREAPKPRVQNTPRMGGSTGGFTPKKPVEPRPQQERSSDSGSSPFAARPSADKSYNSSSRISGTSSSAPSQSSRMPMNDNSGGFSKTKLAAVLLILLGIGLVALIYFLTR